MEQDLPVRICPNCGFRCTGTVCSNVCQMALDAYKPYKIVTYRAQIPSLSKGGFLSKKKKKVIGNPSR